jgi:hypothetical protein
MTNQTAPQFGIAIEDDKRHMHVQILDGSTLKAGIVFNAPELDTVIASLIEIRAQMQPAVPETVSEAPTPRHVKGTHFDFGIDGGSRELIFSLRDPGLGWLSLNFGARLLERMLKIARSAQVTDESSKTKQ